MVAASTWQLPQTSFERTNATDQTSTAPAARTPGPAGGWLANRFFLKRETPLGLHVETSPGPSCYTCGQNFRQSGTPLNCHVQDCGVRSHKLTRCSGVPRSQQSLPWRCPTHGGPGPFRRPTPATAATTRFGQAPGLSPVFLRAA